MYYKKYFNSCVLTGNGHEMELRKGNGHRDVFYKTSTDNGKIWSEATNITAQVNRIYQPQINPLWNFKEDWRTYANTPGHTLQFPAQIYRKKAYWLILLLFNAFYYFDREAKE